MKPLHQNINRQAPEPSHGYNDPDFRALLKENLGDAPENPWFTPRVMNRLPEKRGAVVPRIIQWICYAVAIIGLLALWGYFTINAATDGITLQTLFMAALLPTVALICLMVFAVPAIRRA